MYDLLKLKEKGLKTPLAHARRFGSAHDGAHHWLMHRLTALFNVLLVIWLVLSAFSVIGMGYHQTLDFLRYPLNAIMMLAFVINMFFHMMMGLQVVIEDYIHKPATKITMLVLLKMVGYGGMLVAVLSVLKIILGSHIYAFFL